MSGCMPVVWSRAPVSLGRYWRIRRMYRGGAELRRSERATSCTRSGISANKVILGHPSIWCALLLLFLLLACRGGEEKRKSGGVSAESVGWWGFALALGRRAGRSPDELSGELPWRNKSDWLLMVKSLLHKAVSGRHHLIWSTGAGNLLLAGRGGEERKGAGDLCSASGGWWGNFLLRCAANIFGSSSSVALHRRRPVVQLLSSMAVGQPLLPSSLVCR